MAGRSAYTDADRAKVYVVLQAHNWMVKRAARESGFSESTVRRWKAEFQAGNVPDQDSIDAQVDEFVSDAEVVRAEALAILRDKLPEAKPSELITVVGVLDDKIVRAKGLATSRNEHVLQLPSREEMAELLGGAVEGAIAAAQRRQAEIVDADVVERKALPPAQ